MLVVIRSNFFINFILFDRLLLRIFTLHHVNTKIIFVFFFVSELILTSFCLLNVTWALCAFNTFYLQNNLKHIPTNRACGFIACVEPLILKKGRKKCTLIFQFIFFPEIFQILTKHCPWNFFLQVLQVSFGNWQVSWWITL